ncbi:hypothetical protein ACWCYY_14145 [Kitasatospora sp. NPDC001664]|uniref:hypothetical protein n=1 Tax=Kitasatospora albolonga TaxID=68173 RepID=UPI0031EFC1EB
MLGPRAATFVATALLVGAGLFGAAASAVAAEPGGTQWQSRVEALGAPSGEAPGAALSDVTWGP